MEPFYIPKEERASGELQVAEREGEVQRDWGQAEPKSSEPKIAQVPTRVLHRVSGFGV